MKWSGDSGGTLFGEVILNYGKLIFLGLLLIVSAISVCVIVGHTGSQKLRVSFLDVGQGDSIFIQTPGGHDMLIDGGATNKVIELVSKQMSYFDREIDVVLATHPDADHVTGLVPIFEKYDVRQVMISPSDGHTVTYDDVKKHIAQEHSEVHIAHKGDVVDFHDGVIVRVLYPSEDYMPKKNDTNDASVSVVVTYGDMSFLLTGDLPSIEEAKLIDAGLPHNVTVYKAGHHGSKFSSGELLLSYSTPSYTVVSAGKNNKYGHPNPEAVSRIQKFSKEIISTIDKGTISFITSGKDIEVQTSK